MALVTLKLVAEKAGFHVTTVSRALRGDSRIPASTRDRIQELARGLGYSPDPLLSALSAYRRQGRLGDGSTLAYLTNWQKSHPVKQHWGQAEYFPNAQERAGMMGYRLQEFSLATPGMTAKRLSEILHTRGIIGVIVQDSPYTTERELEGFQWEAFSCCTIGYSLKHPRLPRIAHSPYQSMKVAMQGLLQRGYRRIALWMPRWQDERVEYQWSDAYWGECRRAGQEPLTLLFEKGVPSGAELERVWKSQQPDVIMSYGYYSSERIACQQLKKKRRAPDWFVLNVRGNSTTHAGINLNLDVVGLKAVDVVAARITRRERGPIQDHVVTQVTGNWQEGKSIRPLPSMS
ncbi:MAG: LacI family DNA-binding transcriptional regulator [Verrucomicrobiota bacterium JB024]|nr:LacI family DNA-binding transcriptional regulator [Verrucomicrobiota bacterium JB024]